MIIVCDVVCLLNGVFLNLSYVLYVFKFFFYQITALLLPFFVACAERVLYCPVAPERFESQAEFPVHVPGVFFAVPCCPIERVSFEKVYCVVIVVGFCASDRFGFRTFVAS